MSNIFAGKAAAGETVEEDFIGSGGVFDTDIYEAVIKTAFIGRAAASDARNVTLLLDIDGREVRSQIWVSNRKGEVTYKDKKTGEAKNLPGFNQLNSLCLLVAGMDMGEMVVEELTVKLYDFDAKKELPQAVDCFTALHGEKISVALQRQTVDKTTKNETSGDYEPTGETRDQNEVVKFFAPEKLVTISEVAQFIKSLGGSFDDVVKDRDIPKAIASMSDEAGGYAKTWLDRNKGQTYNKATGKKAQAGQAFSGSTKGTAKRSNLFDD